MHPDYFNHVGGSSIASRSFIFRFRGRPAHSAGDAAVLAAARALAMSAIDIMTSHELAARVRSAFEAARAANS